MAEILKPIYLVQSLGEYAVTPDGAILNFGGTANSTFTVGGKPLLFADGTSTDGGTSTLVIDFQRVYANSIGNATINFTAGKDLVLQAVNNNGFRFDASTGKISITGDLEVSGSINGINLADLQAAVLSHIDLQDDTVKHTASQVSVDTSALTSVTGATVQEVIENLDVRLAGGVVGFEHVQATPARTWSINHARGSKRVQVSIWDEEDVLLFADEVAITSANTVSITFNTPVAGRAILMIF